LPGLKKDSSPRRKKILAARGLIVAGHNARLAPLFVLLVLFLADLAPPFSFFIHLGLLPLTGLLPATALLAASAALLFLLIALFGHQILLVLPSKITPRVGQTFLPVTLWQTARIGFARQEFAIWSVWEKPAENRCCGCP
jgi:hypothetical protein